MHTDKINLACLIDDDSVHAFVVGKMLQKTPNCKELLTFADGSLALNYLTNAATDPDKIPDVIFLDIKMPVMDGWSFLEEFTKIKDTLPKRVKIYMVSSSNNPWDIAKAKTYTEITDYITKPITINQYYAIFMPNLVQMAG